MPRLEGFGDDLNVAVFGASGGIGEALVASLAETRNVNRVYAISRAFSDASQFVHPIQCVEYSDQTLSDLANRLPKLDVVMCAIGLLHDESFGPEKSRSQITMPNMQRIFEVNAFMPTLIAKHMLPKLRKDRKAVFAALSARVGSISDNRLGGWYSYRASKAALNMMIKTLAIEQGRTFKYSAVIGLHPGTVDTPLSKPFQNNVSKEKLFAPDFSASRLLDVVEKVSARESGKIFAWDGEEILP